MSVTSNIGTASLNGNRLQFPKPTQPYPQTQTTSYVLSPQNPGNLPNWKPFDIYQVFNSIPSFLQYETRAYFDTPATLYYNDAKLSAQYKLTLPFVFNDFSMNIKNTIPNLFSEDLYERLFEYAQGDIQIIADSVAVHLDNGTTSIQVEANLLDKNGQSVGISILSDNPLISGNDNNQIIIRIRKEDMEKMKQARDLEFSFHIQGQGAITTRDYIHIQKIRLASDGGIYFTF
jgi:hypothetical protein